MIDDRGTVVLTFFEKCSSHKSVRTLPYKPPLTLWFCLVISYDRLDLVMGSIVKLVGPHWTLFEFLVQAWLIWMYLRQQRRQCGYLLFGSNSYALINDVKLGKRNRNLLPSAQLSICTVLDQKSEPPTGFTPKPIDFTHV